MRRLNNAVPAALESRSREEPLKAGIALLIMILFSSAHGSLKSVAAVALPRDEASEKVVRSKRKVMEFLPSLWQLLLVLSVSAAPPRPISASSSLIYRKIRNGDSQKSFGNIGGEVEEAKRYRWS
ncbi:hypothetical protein DY000_02027065 [Brassica cretica]|uniref:Uncharacterized protein n=1 Tax=Brassica cretica TaxID=69181 RepID=A0ABQ7E3F7_BRACR|nr:hypothetical protein DY000_02027065 [Brassica cretica]